MALQAMWIHGHSAAIELNSRGRGAGEDIGGLQWTAVEGLRLAGGVKYRGQDNSDYRFHFAIPTPVIDDGIRSRLRRVMVLFAADPGVQLTSVQVFDGPVEVFKRDGLGIGGDNLSLNNERNSFELDNREVRFGIGVSVSFHFADPGNVTLVSAGVDFES